MSTRNQLQGAVRAFYFFAPHKWGVCHSLAVQVCSIQPGYPASWVAVTSQWSPFHMWVTAPPRVGRLVVHYSTLQQTEVCCPNPWTGYWMANCLRCCVIRIVKAPGCTDRTHSSSLGNNARLFSFIVDWWAPALSSKLTRTNCADCHCLRPVSLLLVCIHDQSVSAKMTHKKKKKNFKVSVLGLLLLICLAQFLMTPVLSVPGNRVVPAGLFYSASQDANIIGHHVIKGLELLLDSPQLHCLSLCLFGP